MSASRTSSPVSPAAQLPGDLDGPSARGRRSGRRTGLLGAVCAALILGGAACSAPVGESSPSAATKTGSAQNASIADWTPTVPIEHREYTDAEMLSWRDQYLADLARQEGIASAPSVPLVRWARTPLEADEAMVSCLQDSGFTSAQGDADGGVSFDPAVPAGQDAALDAAYYTCTAQYTPVPSLRTDWTDDQLGMLWDYWTQAFVPCVREHRRGVSISDAPSRDAFVSGFYDDPEHRWLPDMEALSGLDDAATASLVAACPTMPPPQYFYGG